LAPARRSATVRRGRGSRTRCRRAASGTTLNAVSANGPAGDVRIAGGYPDSASERNETFSDDQNRTARTTVASPGNGGPSARSPCGTADAGRAATLRSEKFKDLYPERSVVAAHRQSRPVGVG
jgi:hypothetical protein